MTLLARSILSDYRGDILFDATVKEVTQSSQGYGVMTITLSHGRTFTASDVVSTIPLNVLETINFISELSPLRQEALRSGHEGRGHKIHYKISPSAIPRVTVSRHKLDSPFNLGTSDNLDADGGKSSHFVGFGLSGRIADVEDDEVVVAAFNKYLDDDQNRKVDGYACHDWTADPFSKGTWCAYAPGYHVKYHQELQKAHGRIQFVSLDWANGWKGFVDGAIEEGKKAAYNILSAFNLQAA